MALKLDMSKAYDRVEWVCLKGIMEKLGIHRRMVEVVMRCVCTVSYSVRINGKPKGRIIPSGGLRQGTLFLLIYFYFVQRAYLVYLDNRWKEAVSKDWLFCRGAPRISHLFFANDSLIFCQATLEDCEVLQQIFSVYESVSEQQLNRNKIALFFSRNTPRTIQEEIQRWFGALVIRQHEKYFGITFSGGAV